MMQAYHSRAKLLGVMLRERLILSKSADELREVARVLSA